MENNYDRLIALARETFSLAAKVLVRLRNDKLMPHKEREGKIEVIKILDCFSGNIEKDLVSRSWPLRNERQMAGRSVFRGISDIGWYNENRIEEKDVAQLFEMAHRLAEGYRRLPESEGKPV